jgi:hypothetical protein
MNRSQWCHAQLAWCEDALGRLRERLAAADAEEGLPLRALVEILEAVLEVWQRLADAVEQLEGDHR